jgi:phosphoribosylaminoimidazolecarboxamide formyltransferase/IMP cyclohydrolase
MGNGQSNRLESLRISMRKAGDEVKGASLASDAFFLIAWNDTVEKVCEVSIGVVAEHGGSLRNKDTIECCNNIRKKKRERDPHAYLLRLVEAVLIVKGEGGVVPVITERKEMQCSFSRKNCKR